MIRVSLNRRTEATVALRLSSLRPLVGLDHVILLFVGAVFRLPGVALVAELVHLAGVDGSVLLTTGEANNSQALEVEGGDSLLEGGQVHLARDGGDELELGLLVGLGDLLDHGELPGVRGKVGVVGQDRLSRPLVGDVPVDADLLELPVRDVLQIDVDRHAQALHSLHGLLAGDRFVLGAGDRRVLRVEQVDLDGTDGVSGLRRRREHRQSRKGPQGRGGDGPRGRRREEVPPAETGRAGFVVVYGPELHHPSGRGRRRGRAKGHRVRDGGRR
mmetsp:Transcript_10548/g.25407  ORF Transcript_10548/g.25407 Transcript_10548/m.25407 type:complete len:273 (-) Transcript_10548:180-998(-)